MVRYGVLIRTKESVEGWGRGGETLTLTHALLCRPPTHSQPGKKNK